MKTKELIKYLKQPGEPFVPEFNNEIIKRLEELEDSRCRLYGIKMCVEGKVKIKSGK